MIYLPNFLVVGAAKAGTTSLFNYLNQHPDIFIPSRKEGRFFSNMPGNFVGNGSEKFQNDIIVSLEEYSRLFRNGKECLAKGDISNDYLYYYEKSIGNIKKYLGSDIRILIILRNPVDRAYSNYLHHVREGWETLSFEKALEAEESRRGENWAWPYYYKDVGLYYQQVKAYIESFEQVKICFYEELFIADRLMKEIFVFLGLDDNELVDTSKQYNKTGTPRFKTIQKMLNRGIMENGNLKSIVKKIIPEKKTKLLLASIRNMNLKKIPMKKETRNYLKEYFKEDLNHLNRIVQKDCTLWIQ